MKSKYIVLMAVSVGFGLVAAIGMSQVMGNNNRGGQAAIKRGQVVLASRDLQPGEDLNEENVKVEDWPVKLIPEDAVRDLDQIRHKKVTTRLRNSMPLVVADTIDRNDWKEVDVPAGFKLISIKVSAEDHQYGLMQPGNHVDVIGVVNVRSQNPNQRRRSEIVSETFLRGIEVHSINGRLRNTGSIEANGSSASVALLVTEKQSELIALVQKIAKLRLALVGDDAEPGNDEQEFSDYKDFYESVFGKAQNEGADGSDNRNDPYRSHTTRIWGPDGFREVKFQGNRRAQATDATDTEEFEEVDNTDSEDFDRSEENTSDLDEDQYPGE